MWRVLNIMRNKWLKYKEIVLYIFFGGATTLVNILSYYFCSYVIQLNTTMSTVIAWLLSVIFAYITNKIWVFESKTNNLKSIFKEITSFFGCRLVTGLMDLVIMITFVDYLLFNDMIIKIMSNILVIIMNYIASKLVIFKN